MFQVVQAVQVVVQGWARMDGMDAIPAYARTAHNGLLQKKKIYRRGSLPNHPSYPPDNPISQGT